MKKTFLLKQEPRELERAASHPTGTPGPQPVNTVWEAGQILGTSAQSSSGKLGSRAATCLRVQPGFSWGNEAVMGDVSKAQGGRVAETSSEICGGESKLGPTVLVTGAPPGAEGGQKGGFLK